jgi:hypothetical protein
MWHGSCCDIVEQAVRTFEAIVMVLTKEQLVRDPQGTFSEPRRVVENQELTAEQKLTILKSWQLDLLELLRATEENMPSADRQPGEVAEELRQVNDALVAVRREQAHAGGRL